RDELLPRARLRERGVPHVVGDVEALVVDPDRPALVVGHRHQPAAEARQQRETRQHEVAYLGDAEVATVVEELRALEDAQRTDVHRELEPLHVQEAGVERGEPVVLRHLPGIVRVGDRYGLRPMPRVATAVWTISPDLVLALDAQLGLPVDSYVNGSQTWLVDGEPVPLEWRLHPVAGYRAPAG